MKPFCLVLLLHYGCDGNFDTLGAASGGVDVMR